MNKLDKVQIIELPKIEDLRGNLSFLEVNSQIPFSIKRAYWIYDVPGGQSRGGHSFKTQDEIIIALSGSFQVNLLDGHEKKNYTLNRSYFGLYIPCGIWRQMDDFSTNSVALVLSSTHFNEEDYIRDFEEYKKYKSNYE